MANSSAVHLQRAPALVIRLPEGVDFALPLAGPMARFLALLVDFLVEMAICYVLGTVLQVLAVLSFDVMRALFVLMYFLVPMLYGVVCEWWLRGQTIGKRMMRLRVMDATGLRLRFSQVLLRNLLRPVDSLPACYLVGGAAFFLSRRGQRLGDLAAGTIVVRLPEDDDEPDLSPLGETGKYNSLSDHPVLAARLRQRVPAAEAAAALAALARRNQLEPAARVEVFARLAARFRALVTFPEESAADLSDEAYVRNVADLVFRRPALPERFKLQAPSLKEAPKG